jgi:hypothetical protein
MSVEITLKVCLDNREERGREGKKVLDSRRGVALGRGLFPTPPPPIWMEVRMKGDRDKPGFFPLLEV